MPSIPPQSQSPNYPQVPSAPGTPLAAALPTPFFGPQSKGGQLTWPPLKKVGPLQTLQDDAAATHVRTNDPRKLEIELPMTDRARQEHWQKVYTDKSPTAVSWYQSIPARSLALIDAAAARTIIDIGGGASTLVDHLLQRPGIQVCVVDIALRALEHSRARQHSESAARVRWIEADVTGPLDALPDGCADLWHDRAVFHFLTEPDLQLAYARNLARILKPGGTAIIAAFALDGPEKCSGLPVCRHDATSIATAISRAGRTFTPVETQREEHTTPWGSIQAFVYAVLKDSSGVA